MTADGSLVLASASASRARLLDAASIAFRSHPSNTDEAAIKEAARARGMSVENTAIELAIAKARVVSVRHKGAWVIGADQILECDGVWFDKSRDLCQAATVLRSLRDRTHTLVSGVAVVCDRKVRWRYVETARLTMRRFSDDFLERYLDRIGSEATETVGAYRIEGPGIQLFSEINGDHSTILGLPLLPLLAFLRQVEVIQA